MPWLTLFDFKGIFANFVKDNELNYREKSENFVILIPIFNDIKYLVNIDFLKKYKDKVVLCTTTFETEKFYKDIYKLSKKYGFKVLKCKFGKEVKNPWKIYQKTLLAHDYVLGESLKSLNADYVIFLDADTTCRTDLRYLVGEMQKKDYDLASLRVIPSKKSTVTENLQYIEYHVAMKSRRIYPWLTSGAAMIGKRISMQKIMKEHSLFFNGGDIEIGKLAHLSGLKVGHIPVTFYTDVPETFPKLVKQRFSWFCGAFRHSVINAHTNLFNPIYSLYFTIVIFLMLPLKFYELIANWFILPPIMLFYMMMVIVTNWDIKNKYMFLFPAYSLFQVLILPVCGIGRYCKTVFQTKNIGFIKKFYKKDYPPARYALNILFILLMIFLIFNMNLIDRTLMVSDVDLFSLVGISFKSSDPFSILYNASKIFMVMTLFFFCFFGLFKAHYYMKYKKGYKRLTKYFLSIFGIIC